MSKKLLEDENVVKLIARECKKAVKEDRARITGAVKELKQECYDGDDGETKIAPYKAQSKVIAQVNKIVRDAA